MKSQHLPVLSLLPTYQFVLAAPESSFLLHLHHLPRAEAWNDLTILLLRSLYDVLHFPTPSDAFPPIQVTCLHYPSIPLPYSSNNGQDRDRGWEGGCHFPSSSQSWLPFMTEKMFRVGHFFLHVESLWRLENLARTFERVVVWLPVFTKPSMADAYYRSAITLSPKMERIWRHFQQREAALSKFPRSDPEFVLSERLTGFTRKAFGREMFMCEEVGPSQWPSVENNLPLLIHKTFPELSELVVIEFRKHVVYPTDEEGFTELFDWAYDIVKADDYPDTPSEKRFLIKRASKALYHGITDPLLDVGGKVFCHGRR